MKFFHKYGAKPCEWEGIKFPSKLERNVYIELCKLRDEGKILFILRQIPFDLDHGKHRVDFCVFTPDDVIFIEAKGRDLGDGKFRRLSVENRYNIPIRVVKSVKEVRALFPE